MHLLQVPQTPELLSTSTCCPDVLYVQDSPQVFTHLAPSHPCVSAAAQRAATTLSESPSVLTNPLSTPALSRPLPCGIYDALPEPLLFTTLSTEFPAMSPTLYGTWTQDREGQNLALGRR